MLESDEKTISGRIYLAVESYGQIASFHNTAIQ
jgi:hypothetical protein